MRIIQTQNLENNVWTTSRDATHRKAAGLTLVELLVVIVILVTLVGGVLPVLSPNNDSRKIEAASRGLKTYFQKAQTRAIRTGRPVGVAFRETSLGSGVALEVYQVENPRAFTGFSSESTAKFYDPDPDDNTFIYIIEFGEGFGNKYEKATQPVIPPRMIRNGDVINIGSSRFQVTASPRYLDDEGFFLPTSQFGNAKLVSGPAPPTVPVNLSDFKVHPITNEKSYLSYPENYAIDRQPIPTSEAPYVLPKGTAIDMHASGIDGGTSSTLLAANNFNNLKQVSLMFSPSGGVDSIYYNGRRYSEDQIINGQADPGAPLTGQRITDASKFIMLLSQVELGGAALVNDNQGGASPQTGKWRMEESDTDERLAEVREEVSWLNPDSRWLLVHGRSGKPQTAKNPAIDPRNAGWDQFRNSPEEFAFQQIKEIHRRGSGNSVLAIDPQSNQ